MSESNERRKALDVALNQIEKQFGKGSVMRLGEYKAMEIESIPTGALALDIALGIGGLPRGRIIRKNNFSTSCNSRSTKTRWRGCFYRCRACIRPNTCKKIRCRYR